MALNKKMKIKIIEHFGFQGNFAEAVGAHYSLVSCVVNNKQVLSKRLQEK